MKKRGFLKQTLTALALSGTVAFFVYAFHIFEPATHLTFLSVAEDKLVDQRFRIRGPEKPSGDVLIVAIDSHSIEDIGRWPWSRTTHTQLIDRLREWGATTVAFDVLFTETEGVREAAMLNGLAAALPADADERCSAPVRQAIDDAVSEVLADRAFTAALERTYDDDKAYAVLAFDFVFEEDIAHTRQIGTVLQADDEQIVLDFGSYLSRDENVKYLRMNPTKLALGIRPVVTDLAEQAAGLGFANPVYDSDGVLRRELLTVTYSPSVREAYAEGRTREALLDESSRVQAFMPLAVAGVATHLRLSVDQLKLDFASGSLSWPSPDDDGKQVFEFDPEDGTVRINFFGAANTIPTYSFVDVLNGEIHDAEGRPLDGPATFGGKLVFVGASDPGLGDFFVTPFTARLTGVEKHATVADNMLHGRILKTHADYDLVVGITTLLTAILVAIVAGNLPTLMAAGVLVLTTLSWYTITQADFSVNGMIWNWTVPTVTLVLGYAAVTAFRQLTEERAKRQIRSAFSTYMSPAAVNEVLSNPDKLKLGGERRTCSIFFSDLVGFTSLSESIGDPHKLVQLMNRYLGRMTEKILEEDGILDKYIGDAIMAIFGAPINHPDHAARACNAALKNMDALAELQQEFKAEGLPNIDCRIGINTGLVVVGNMGSVLRMDYTCLGDAVNLASRLEGANKQYGTRMMVGETTRIEAEQHDDNLAFRRLDLIAVKGKAEPVQVHQLVGRMSELGDEDRERITRYEQALKLYRDRQFQEASNAFKEILKVGDTIDGPSQAYIERCRAFIQFPPGEDWDGVFRMQTK